MTRLTVNPGRQPLPGDARARGSLACLLHPLRSRQTAIVTLVSLSFPHSRRRPLGNLASHCHLALSSFLHLLPCGKCRPRTPRLGNSALSTAAVLYFFLSFSACVGAVLWDGGCWGATGWGRRTECRLFAYRRGLGKACSFCPLCGRLRSPGGRGWEDWLARSLVLERRLGTRHSFAPAATAN